MLKKDIIFKMVEDQVKLDKICWKRANLVNIPTNNVRLALLVELGELANELNEWKYWKQSRKVDMNNVKGELADCLHFALSNLYIKNNKDLDVLRNLIDSLCGAITHINFSSISITELLEYCFSAVNYEKYQNVLKWLFIIGEKLGMNFEDIVNCYYEKYKINLERQSKNY